jgi:hypothetical protein
LDDDTRERLLIVFQPWFEEGESPESVFIHEVLKAEHPYMKKREA